MGTMIQKPYGYIYKIMRAKLRAAATAQWKKQHAQIGG